MKVLQVNCVYKNGSTGKIVYDIHETLKKKGIDSVVCYGRGQKENECGVYKTSSEFIAKFNNLKSRFTGIQYNGCYLATKKIISIIKTEKPDIVHLHCINGFFVNIYKLLEFLKNSNIKTVLTLHAEFMYTGNCGHSFECDQWKTGCKNCPNLKNSTNSYIFDKTHESWKKMKNAFDQFDNLVVTSVSPWLESRARESTILKDKIHTTVLNGINTKDVFYYRKNEQLKEQLGLSNQRILLHVTADFSNEVKGGKYIVDLANRLKNENIKIVLIGNKNKNIKLPENIIDIGRVENQDVLAQYYSMADVTIITSKRETFSMVCAESLACGTPVVGFKSGGPEQISIKEYSDFVNYGDIDALLECIKKWINKDEKSIRTLYEIARNHYSKEKMIEGYMKVYEI